MNKKNSLLKKKWFLVPAVILGLFVIYVLINAVDAGKADGFDGNDLPSSVFDADNGYYRLWTLTETPGTDITAPETLLPYRQITDPGMDYRTHLARWDQTAFEKKFTPLQPLRELISNKGPKDNWIDGFVDNNKDWGNLILEAKKDVRAAEALLTVYTERYKKLTATPKFIDFTPHDSVEARPDLLAWLQISRIYIVVNMLNAMEGDWDQSVDNLLDHLDFGKRAVGGSRMLINNLVAKAVTNNTLQGLACLMNREDCPEVIYHKILDRMPPADYAVFGNEKSLKWEFNSMVTPESMKKIKAEKLGGFKGFIISRLTQNNRTAGYYKDFMDKLIEAETTAPYKWSGNLTALRERNAFHFGSLWWLHNPGGKLIMKDSEQGLKNLYTTILKSHRLKALYDLVRISAELHLKYTGDQPVEALLPQLNTYKSIDPCSGQPYKWNAAKQVLYGIGTDLTDDQGMFDYKTMKTDHAIPVTLFVK